MLRCLSIYGGRRLDWWPRLRVVMAMTNQFSSQSSNNLLGSTTSGVWGGWIKFHKLFYEKVYIYMYIVFSQNISPETPTTNVTDQSFKKYFSRHPSPKRYWSIPQGPFECLLAGCIVLYNTIYVEHSDVAEACLHFEQWHNIPGWVRSTHCSHQTGFQPGIQDIQTENKLQNARIILLSEYGWLICHIVRLLHHDS